MTESTRRCEICGREIPAERTECLPDTRLCIEHAQAISKYGGEFIVTVVRTSLGKAGSLKKNWGDVTPRRTRNQAALDRIRREYEQGRGDG